jgi:hypothetical protein
MNVYREIPTPDEPRSDVTRARRSLLLAALGFAHVRVADPPPALLALRSWLDSWRGVGDVIMGCTVKATTPSCASIPMPRA